MSLSDALATVPTMLAGAFGAPAVEWRAVVGSGCWATLTGAHTSSPRLVQGYDEDRGREVDELEIRIAVPSTSQALVPGYEVRLGEVEDLEFAVKEVVQDSTHGVAIYRCARRPTGRFAPNRRGR